MSSSSGFSSSEEESSSTESEVELEESSTGKYDEGRGPGGEVYSYYEEVMAPEEEHVIVLEEDDDKCLENEPETETGASANTAKKESSKQPSWGGNKLFPPSRKSPNPSRAWLFGGFRKDRAGQLITDKTVCGLCGEEQRYRSTPTNLAQHLSTKHSLQFGVSSSSKASTIGDFFKPSSHSKYKTNHPRQKAIKAKIVEWVISSNRPLSVVEDEKLIEAFALADDKFQMPTRNTVKNDIFKMNKVKKAETIEELAKIDHFACTNDAGSSSGAKSFIDINVHYVTEDFELKKKILNVLEMKEDKTAVNYRRKVDKTEEKFGIKGKVFSYTTDNEATMRKAFNKEERNGCFAHVESKSSKKCLEKQKPLKNLRVKLRKISKKANKSSKFKYAIQNQQKRKGLRVLSLKQEVKTRFTATHACIRSFLNDPNEKTEEPLDEVKVEENIAAINAAMVEAKFSKKDIASLEIKNEDTRKMKELVTVLDVLEEGITLIGAEKYSTGSAVLPFIKKFNKVLGRRRR